MKYTDDVSAWVTEVDASLAARDLQNQLTGFSACHVQLFAPYSYQSRNQSSVDSYRIIIGKFFIIENAVSVHLFYENICH